MAQYFFSGDGSPLMKPEDVIWGRKNIGAKAVPPTKLPTAGSEPRMCPTLLESL